METLKTIPTLSYHHTLNPLNAASFAGLRYVSDQSPGIQRLRAGKGFLYRDGKGRLVREKEILSRIRALAIPPAWQGVWICSHEHGHLQAVGRDSRGRKQYRYHAKWRKIRDETKYHKMIAFGKSLPKLRKRVARDLKHPGLSRNKVIATVIRLLEVTLIRIGNEEYAQENHHFGLTTLRNRHVTVGRSSIRFQFRGKSGVLRSVQINDPKLARIVKRCQDLPGHELFQFIDDEGKRHCLDSADVNSYLRETLGEEFTAKDFRTWAGTVLAAQALIAFEETTLVTQLKKNVVKAVEQVAQRLGNTRAVCRKSYIHPTVVEAYLQGILVRGLSMTSVSKTFSAKSGLSPQEKIVLCFLQDRLRRESLPPRRRAA